MSDNTSTIAAAADNLITTISFHEVAKKWKAERSIVDIAATENGRLLAIATADPNINGFESHTVKAVQKVHRPNAPGLLVKVGQIKAITYLAHRGL